ncbi:hypothetical protein [Nostoc sp. MS1]|uniref:hypothetical protein n=1 Tax=Nostoc sp. MS1 TaxID=2764711 RepID=UPI001CC78056|nr:hypothetical protein [Nostoc sp. MS1]BCL37164.1 hypothetical protein NSMS1_36110 [Nostoc sp. MS1]
MKEQSQLFTELSSKESAAVSGGIGVSFDLDTYLFILGAGVMFGNPGLTSDEVHFAWMSAFVFTNKRTSDNDIGVSRVIRRNSRRSSLYF